jgi:hypothetical protein
MSDWFENKLKARKLSKETILEAVDEYSLYCFYLGFDPELKTRYSSPIRESDPDPSFSMFYNWGEPCEFLWKDSGQGNTGDIFFLIKKMFPQLTSNQSVFEKIDTDFKLGFTKGEMTVTEKIILKNKPVDKPVTNIRIKSKEFTEEAIAFWESFGVNKHTLHYYDVTQVEYLWTNDYQEVPISPKGLAFAYKELDKFKIYQPYDREFKFRNNYPNRYIEGFFQLKRTTDLLIITKSRKDVMVLFQLGYESVSPKSENTVMPHQYFTHFAQNYKRVVVLFDNDMKHKGDSYPFEKIYVPLDSGEKDVSDYRRTFGEDATRRMLKDILS